MACGKCLQTVAHGAAGLAKVAAQSVGLPVDVATDDVVKARRDACRTCPHLLRNHDPKFERFRGLTTWSRCAECTCLVSAKTRVASEACPLQWWLPVHPLPMTLPSRLPPVLVTA